MHMIYVFYVQIKNELIRVIKRIDLQSRENCINVNRKKSGIFVVKSGEQNDNVDGYFNNK